MIKPMKVTTLTVLRFLAGAALVFALSGCRSLVSYNENHHGNSKSQVLNVLFIPIWSHNVTAPEPPPTAPAQPAKTP